MFIDIFFTICSNNYLAQASVLAKSVQQFHPGSRFIVALADRFHPDIKYDELGYEVIPVHTIVPETDEMALRYNIIELNTAVKPGVIEYLFNVRQASAIVFFDPDVRLFGPLSEIEQELDNCNMVLTPHVLSPIPLDGKSPSENLFLNYGIYNLGFIALKKCAETFRFNDWWKERTYKQGYDRVVDGLFVDQLPVILLPVFFQGAVVLKHHGYNMAPWNLHERRLSRVSENYMVNERELLRFYHFSGFKQDSIQLPKMYNRFTMQDRPDLLEIYNLYNTEFREVNRFSFSTIPCYYVRVRKAFLEGVKNENWKNKPALKKLVIRASRLIPSYLRNQLAKIGHLG